MKNRYENIELLRTELGKRFKKTIRYPKMSKESQDMYIISIQGDRLDNLAYKYYEDARLWWILARANNLGKGDMEIPIGTQLRIPYNYIAILDEYNELNK
jgi:phage tail protein X|tara:strand:- start:2582 stop:2881 length:300 start_codon:yes stop_codon:yes gene_type:complete